MNNKSINLSLSTLYEIVFNQSGEAIMITDNNDRVLLVNQAFTELTGFELSEIKDQVPEFLKSGEQAPGFYEEIWRIVHDTGFWKGEVGHRKKTGELIPNWLSITAARNNITGEINNYISIFSDFSSEKAQKEHLLSLAHHDFLTGLPNRVLLYDRFEQMLKTRNKLERQNIGIFFIDLDGFKPINDNYGHKIGDIVLKRVATRLLSCVRASDTVSRIGGDEFVLLLPCLNNNLGMETIAKKILNDIACEFEIDNIKISLSASIGISLYPTHAKTIEDLINLADKAMYKAKGIGNNSFCLYQ